MKIGILLGTRPEIIKMSPIIRELGKKNADYFILHTGQHYSYNMDRVFFEQLKLPGAKYNIEVGSGTHAEQTARIVTGVEKVLQNEKPAVVLVQGDTNTVMAGALAAAKLNIKIGHVEAGLRSYDRRMPEEINRVLTDHCSDYLFAPTKKAKDILLNEGIPEEKIFVTGNTIVDAVLQNVELAKSKEIILDQLDINPKNYFLVTLHRQENVDDPARFGPLLQALDDLASVYGLPVVYPIHPRSRKRMEEFGFLAGSSSLRGPGDTSEAVSLSCYTRLPEDIRYFGVEPCETLSYPDFRFPSTAMGNRLPRHRCGESEVKVKEKPHRLNLIEPLDFLEFLSLENNAKLVLTDSGGVQEESCILGVPCVTLRDNTERPETVEAGANMVAGAVPERIMECSKIMLEKGNSWHNPFGDGNAAMKTILIVTGGW